MPPSLCCGHSALPVMTSSLAIVSPSGQVCPANSRPRPAWLIPTFRAKSRLLVTQPSWTSSSITDSSVETKARHLRWIGSTAAGGTLGQSA